MAASDHKTWHDRLWRHCRTSGQSHQNDTHVVYWLAVFLVAGLTLGAVQPEEATTADRDALITAAYEGDTTTINALLAEGFDLNWQREDGTTALYLAAQEGHTKVVQLLLANKADIHVRANTGATALMVAAQTGDEQIVQDLLAKGAEVNVQANNGVTALSVAKTDQIAKLLKAAGATH